MLQTIWQRNQVIEVFFCLGESISTYQDLQKIKCCSVYSCIDTCEPWKEGRVAVLRTGLKLRLKTQVANPQPACVLHHFSGVLARTKV